MIENPPAEFAAAQASSYVAQNMLKEKPEYDRNEDILLDRIDDKQLLAEMMTEFLPVFKKIRSMRNLDDQLSAIARMAPYVLAKNMLFGNSSEAGKAAGDVLNRVQGKPIERVMTMTMQVENMSAAEIDNELKRLDAKLGDQEAETQAPVDERAVVGGN